MYRTRVHNTHMSCPFILRNAQMLTFPELVESSNLYLNCHSTVLAHSACTRRSFCSKALRINLPVCTSRKHADAVVDTPSQSSVVHSSCVGAAGTGALVGCEDSAVLTQLAFDVAVQFVRIAQLACRSAWWPTQLHQSRFIICFV